MHAYPPSLLSLSAPFLGAPYGVWFRTPYGLLCRPSIRLSHISVHSLSAFDAQLRLTSMLCTFQNLKNSKGIPHCWPNQKYCVTE